MKTYIKIVMAGINIICLSVTLLYPNSVTSISLLPVIITVSSWVFLSNGEHLSASTKKRRREYLVFSTVFAVLCTVMGVTGRIQQAVTGSDSISGYSIRFTDETAIIGGLSLDYFWFGLIAFISITFLVISEVIATHKGEVRHQQVMPNRSWDELVKVITNSASSVRTKNF